MTKLTRGRWGLFLLTGVLLLLVSCASPPPPRPQAMVDGERLLQQGTAAFYNDQYQVAASSFNQALNVFRSIDHQAGIVDSYINLVETSIAIDNLPLAQQQLKQAESIQHRAPDADLATRIRLLWVRWYFKNGDYPSAQKHLDPLIPLFDDNNRSSENNRHTLNIISSQARLSVTQQQKDAELWLARLRTAIEQRSDDVERYRALLYRLEASRQQQLGHLDESIPLLEKALAIHHRLNHRRGIAACLQQMAGIEMQRGNWLQADQYSQRALPVFSWTLNRQAVMLTLQRLITINTHLDNPVALQKYRAQLDGLNQRSDP